MAKFFTSDTHFGHAKAIEHGRPFGSVEEMEEAIVERWNRVVKPGDKVYHLGDFAMGQRDINVPKFAKRLLGDIILIVGNHDYTGYIHKHKSEEKRRFYKRLYHENFWSVKDWDEDTVCGVAVELYHLPFVGDHEGMEARFLNERPVPNENRPLLHGHVHDTWLVRQDPDLPVMINVGVDMWDFTPVSEEQLEPWLK